MDHMDSVLVYERGGHILLGLRDSYNVVELCNLNINAPSLKLAFYLRKPQLTVGEADDEGELAPVVEDSVGFIVSTRHLGMTQEENELKLTSAGNPQVLKCSFAFGIESKNI
eukprot:gene6477-7216_t